MSFLFGQRYLQRRVRRISDRETMEILNLERRTIRDAKNPFLVTDDQFRKWYRISKAMAYELCTQLEEFLQRKDPRGLPVHVQVIFKIVCLLLNVI